VRAKIERIVEIELNTVIRKAFQNASKKVLEKLADDDFVNKEIENRVRLELNKNLVSKITAKVQETLSEMTI
jgi:hypothetical protein